MANKIINDFTILFKTVLDEKSKQEVGKNIRGLLNNAVISFDESEIKRNVVPIVNMIQQVFDKAGIKFDGEKLLGMSGKDALQSMANMKAEEFQNAFNKALAKSGGVKIDFGDVDISGISASLNQLESELSDIHRKVVDAPKKSVSEIEDTIRKLKSSQKSVQQIERTLNSVNKQGNIQSKNTAVNSLTKAYQDVVESQKTNDPWQTQYQNMLKFVSKYEAMAGKIKPLVDASNPEFKQLYDMLSPKSSSMKISLQHFVDIANGNELTEYKHQPWARESTLQSIEQALRLGISVKGGTSDGSESTGLIHTASSDDNDNKNKLPVTKEVASKTPNIALDKQARIEAEKKAQAETITTEATEKRRIAEEKIAATVKKITVYRGIIPPEESLTRKKFLNKGDSSEWWSSNKNAAQTYADMDKGGAILKGTIVPKNPLVIDAGGHNYDEFQKMPGIKNIINQFPQLIQLINSKADVTDIQRHINTRAAELGYDIVQFDNVNDVLNPSLFKELGSTFAILNDNVLKVNGAFKMLSYDEEESMGDYSEKASKKDIPEYYQMPEVTENDVTVHKANADAINREYQEQNKLNQTEAQNSPVKDDSDVHNANANSINNETQAQKELNQSENQNPNIESEIKKEAMSYDELKQKVETYIKVRQQMFSLMDRNKPWQYMLPNVEAARADIANLFPEKGDKPTDFTTSMVGNMLGNQTISEDHIRQLAIALGIEIPQAANNAKQAVDGLNSSLEKKNAIEGADNGGVEVAEESAKTDEIKQQNAALKENISLKAQADGNGVAAPTDIGTKTPVVTTLQITGVSANEVTDLETVRKKVTEVTNAINTKTQAFLAEQKAVKNVAKAEVHALSEVEKKVNSIKVALSNVSQVLSNIKSDVSVGSGLSNININVNRNDDKNADQNNVDEPVIQRLLRNTYTVKLEAADNTETNKMTIDEAILRGILNNITYKVRIVNSDAQTKESKVSIDESSLESILRRVFVNRLGTNNNSEELKVDSNSVKAETDVLVEQYHRILNTVEEWKTLYSQLQTITGSSTTDFRKQMLPMLKQMSPELVNMIGGSFSEGFAKGFKGVKTKDIFASIQQISNADLLGSVTDQVNLLKNIDLSNFNFNELPINETNIHFLREAFDILKKIDVLRQKNNTSNTTLEGSATQSQQMKTKEPRVREDILKSIHTILDAIQKNTASLLGDKKGQQSTNKTNKKPSVKTNKPNAVNTLKPTDNLQDSSNVDNVLAIKNILSSIKTTVERINSKIVKGTTSRNNNDESKRTYRKKDNIESDVGSQFSPEKIKTQSMYLAKFRAQLMTTGKLTDDVDLQIYELLNGLSKIQNGPDFSKWNQQFLQLKTKVGIGDIFGKAEDKISTASYERLIELQKTRNKLELQYTKAEDGSPLKQFYAEQIAQMDGVIAKQEELILNEQQRAKFAKLGTEQSFKIQENAAKKETQNNKKALAADKKLKKRQAMVGKANSIVSRAESAWLEAGELDHLQLPDTFQAQVMQHREELDKLILKLHEVNIAQELTDDDVDGIRRQTAEVNKQTEALSRLVAEYQKLSGDNVDESLSRSTNLNFDDKNLSITDYEKQMKAYVADITNGQGKIKEFNAETKTLTYTMKTGRNEYTEYTAAVRNLDHQLVSVRGSTKKAETFFQATARKMRELSSYFTGMTLFYRITSVIRQGIGYIKEIDAALTELKKVTDETEETYEKFLDTASKTADKVGSTIKDVVSSTADWARLGYTIQEAHKLAESTQILMNVSEFTDVNQATDSLISSIQAFKYTAEESMGVVDILNTIGNNYAISTADLAQSLTKSSSALVAANGTLEEAVALTAAANTTVQDADVVGTALKTTSMRLRGTDISTMEEEGIETDGYTSKSKLRGKIKAIAGVDILTETGDYKSTYQILSEIAKVWKDISDIDQAALLELLAGKRSGSVMAAILQNPDVLKDAFESANKAQGSAQDELEKYMDSFQGRLDKMTNTIQTMWQNALDNDFVKMIISFGTELVKIVNNVGLLKSLFIAIGTIIVQKHFQGDLFGGLFGDKSKRLDNARARTKAAEEKYKRTGHEKDRAEWEAQKQREEMLSKEAEDLKAKETPKSQKTSKAKKSTYKDPSIVSAEEKLKIAKEELKTAKEAKKAEKIKHKGETKQVKQTFKDAKKPVVLDAKRIELNDLEVKKGLLDMQITGAEKRLQKMQAGEVPDFLRREVDSSKIKGPFDDIIASEQKQLDIETDKLSDLHNKRINRLSDELAVMRNQGLDAYKEFNANNPLSAEDEQRQIDAQKQKVQDIRGRVDSLTAQNKAAKTQQIDNIVTENAQAEINALKNDLLDIENKIRNINSEINNTKNQGTSKTGQTPNNIKSDKKSKDNTSNADENIKKAKQSVKQAKKDLKKKQKTPIDLDAEQKNLQELEAKQSQLLEKQAAAQAQVKQANQDLLKANVDMRKGVEGIDDATFEAYGNAKAAAKENLKSVNDELKVNQEQIDATKLKIQQEGLISSMATMYLMTTIMDLAGKAINSIVEWGKDLSQSPEEAHEEFENLNNELQATESELDSLKSELETTKDRIDELLEKDSLSMVEKDELSKLQQTNRELEHQIKLNETLAKQQRQSVNDASFNAMSKYSSQTSFYSEKTKSEREEEAKETGSTIGSTAGMIIGGIIGTIAGGQTVVGAGIGAALGGALGGAAGEAIESSSYLSELSVKEAIDDMELIRAGLRADISTAEQAIIDADGKATEEQKQALQEAEQTLADFDSNMANSMSQLQQYINAIDYSSLTDPKEQQKYRDALDNVLKYNIEMGVQGATKNALSTMFSEDLITDDLKRVQDIVMTALDVNGNVDFDYLDKGGFSEQDQKAIDDVKARLESVGVTTTRLIAHFKELKNTEQEAMEYETSDVVKEVSALTNGVSLLKEAFDEFNESGIVTAETLIKLNEVFGETDGWKNYIDAMSSGVLSTQEVFDVTNQLAESWMVDKIDDPFAFATWDGEKFKHNKDAYLAYLTEIQQLQALGVTNARELIDAAQQEGLVKAAVETMNEVQRVATLKEEGKATTEELAWLEENRKDSAEGYADTIYEQYGVRIKDTALIEKQYELMKAQDNIDKYKDHGSSFNGSDNDFLQRYKSSIDKINKFSSDYTTAQNEENKWAHIYQTDYWKGFKQNFLGNLGLFTGEKSVTELVKDAANKKNTAAGALQNQIKATQEIWDEMMEIAEEEGLTFEVDTTAFDASKTDQANQKIFDSVYNTVAAHVEKKKEEFEKTAEEIKKQLDTAFDSVGLEVILELQDKDKLVDDIQSVYDELINAQKEYAENGYVTVDTMQTLFKLEPKYLDLLVDENGKLNLNKTSLLEVARARILDLGYKQQSTILENAWALASQGSTDAMREQILVMEQATKKEKDWINTQMASIRTALDKRVAAKEMTKAEADAFYTGTLDQVKAVQTTMNLALSDLENTLSSSGNTKKQELEDAFQKAMDYWENRIGANQSLYEQIQNDIDLLEKKGKIAGESYYQAQIDVEKEHLEHLKAQRAEARGFLDDFAEGTDEWWNVANTLNDIENEIDGVTASIQDLNDAQDQVHWTIFDEAHERMESLITQLSNVREILSADEDSFFDDTGEWTDTGIAVLATHIQEIELAEGQLIDVEKELNKLKRSNFDSEQEYYDKLTELTDKQHSYATAISSSEQSIVDMYESSMDAAEEYTQTLIDEYSEYIDSVKEALDAERDLYDFRKSVQKESKNIAELERKISALSASDNKADIAERRKLEQQLTESKESLNDQYYDHARDAQQNALDAEVAAYEETLTKMVEGMRTSLEEATTNMQAFLDSVTIAVSMNADSVLKKYQSTELYLDSALTNPWVAAKEAVGKYGADANNLMDVWAKDGYFAKFSSEAGKNLKSPFNAGKTAAEQFGKTVDTSMGNMYTSVKSNVENSITQLNKLKTKYDEINDTTIRPPSTSSSNGNSNDTSINPKATNKMIEKLQYVLKYLFGQDIQQDGIWGPETALALKRAKELMIKKYGISVNTDDKYTTETRNAILAYINKLAGSSIGPSSMIGQGNRRYMEFAQMLPDSFYAKGTTGTKRDELAIVDELGPELILHANPQTGRLEYLTKGSGVVPADLTANLMEWGQFTPDSMNLGSGVNVNMINNSVVKPQYDFNFDSLVHVDHCDQNTVKDLEKMIDNKINDFSKALNYSVKRFAR